MSLTAADFPTPGFPVTIVKGNSFIEFNID